MAKEFQSTDITTIASVPELLQLVDEVQRSHQPHLLKRRDEQVAMIVPVSKPRRARGRRSSRHDWLLRLVDIGATAASEGKRPRCVGQQAQVPG